MDSSAGGSAAAAAGLMSSPPLDLFTRNSAGESASAAQRQSPWTLGPSPRTTTDPQTDGTGDTGTPGGTSTVAAGGVPGDCFILCRAVTRHLS